MHNAARYALGAFAGAAIISGVGIGVAMAGDDGASEQPGSESTTLQLNEGALDGFLARLAAKLGVDPETLRSAIQDSLAEEVQQAADDGRITQETADRINGHIENGSWADPFGDEGLFDWLPTLPELEDGESPLELLPEVADIERDIAEFLGTTEAELDSLLEDGATLGEAAESLGVSQGDLEQFLLERALEIINDERVPEELRELMQSGLESLIEAYVNGELTLDGLFGGGMFSQP